MVRIVKHQSNNGTIEYEFVEFDCWDDFDTLVDILVQKMDAVVIEKLDGIYSRHWIFVKNGVKFKLMYHEDTGNCLVPLFEDDCYYSFIEDMAYKMLPFVMKHLSNN